MEEEWAAYSFNYPLVEKHEMAEQKHKTLQANKNKKCA